MKRIIFSLIAAFVLTLSAQAQNDNVKNQPQKRNPQEMIKHRTDMMVKTYGLDADQAKKLQELNEKFAQKLPRMNGPRGGHHNQQQGNNRPSREEMQKRFADMRANVEAYNVEVKKIMTEEQYKKYTDNQSKMHNGRRGGHRGND